PQSQAAVARIPEFTEADVQARKITIVLDGVQDPGNVGAILRLCLGFDASLILVESADVTNPKVIRSSAGAMFKVPWMQVARDDVSSFVKKLDRPVFRLEKTASAEKLGAANIRTPLILIAGSEGQGITLETKGRSIFVEHSSELESLNVGNALAIALYTLQQK
ncbi:RNA methyltransferase, partial [Patescibacteria group bacterium]|nr:RNA methyltransferase [Patescibacteria group bacterium]